MKNSIVTSNPSSILIFGDQDNSSSAKEISGFLCLGSFNCDGRSSTCGLNIDPSYITHYLKFSVTVTSNSLWLKPYSDYQFFLHNKISKLKEQGLGYRRISQWLNKSGIKTHTGKKWFNSSVISVIKIKHERDIKNQQIRNQHFPSKVSRFEVNYYIFD